MAPDIFKKLLETPRRRDFSGDIDENNIDLSPVSGGKVLHTLDPEEKKELLNLLGVKERLEELYEDVQIHADISLAHNILDGGKSIADSYAGIADDPDVQSLLDELLYMEALWKKVDSTFWFNLRMRINCFTSFLEIRAGYTVVEVGSKIRKGSSPSNHRRG